MWPPIDFFDHLVRLENPWVASAGVIMVHFHDLSEKTLVQDHQRIVLEPPITLVLNSHLFSKTLKCLFLLSLGSQDKFLQGFLSFYRVDK
jgi:hypothetical protein